VTQSRLLASNVRGLARTSAFAAECATMPMRGWVEWGASTFEYLAWGLQIPAAGRLPEGGAPVDSGQRVHVIWGPEP
jgi:hypothetical protein